MFWRLKLMKKILAFIILLFISVTFAGCNTHGFSKRNVRNVENLKCYVSTVGFFMSEDLESNGIDDGSGSTATVIEDQNIKDAYDVIVNNLNQKTKTLDYSDGDGVLYLAFYTGDESASKVLFEGLEFYGAFVVTENGSVEAYNTPQEESGTCYTGASTLYSEIMRIISECRN